MRVVLEVAAGVPVVRASATQEDGMSALLPYLEPAQTVAFVGSSGVGKSSLINRLFAEAKMETGSVRMHDQTGMHTTTHRQLLCTSGGALLIDTPGMRELGLWEAQDGLSAAFPELAELAEACRFSDCQHEREPGCAVQHALRSGLLPEARLASYLQLSRELAQQRKRTHVPDQVEAKQRFKAMQRAHRQGRKLHGKLGWDGD